MSTVLGLGVGIVSRKNGMGDDGNSVFKIKSV